MDLPKVSSRIQKQLGSGTDWRQIVSASKIARSQLKDLNFSVGTNKRYTENQRQVV